MCQLYTGPLQPIRQLDGLRAGAFLAVFFHHALRVPLFWAGVNLLFVLSGFLITSILNREKGKPAGEFFRPFYVRRFRRIVSPYLLILLVAGMFFTVDWAQTWSWYALFKANLAES